MIEHCLKKLEAKELRPTKNREVILRVLHEAKRPLAPPEVVKECHRLGRQANKTTIYRELEQMEKAGVVQKVMVSDRKQYFELTERDHHHHLVCVKCEKIEDIFLEEHDFEHQTKVLAHEKQFSVLHHSLEIFGFCNTCQP